MDVFRYSSFLLSLILHLGVFVLVLFWPAPEALPTARPGGPVITGMVTLGKPGNTATAPKETAARPQEAPPAPEPKPEPPAEVKPEVKPEVKAEVKPEVKPEPVKEDVVAIKKEPEKPNTKNATKPPEKTAEKKVTPAKNATKAAETPTPPKKDAVAGALKDLKKNQSGSKPSSGKGESLEDALAGLNKQYGGRGSEASGDGPGGSGGDGQGVLGTYGESIVSRVKKNWRWVESANRRQYEAIVLVTVGPEGGTATNVSLQRSSGSQYFDSTVLQAVAATTNLEPPPANLVNKPVPVRFIPE